MSKKQLFQKFSSFFLNELTKLILYRLKHSCEEAVICKKYNLCQTEIIVVLFVLIGNYCAGLYVKIKAITCLLLLL